MTVTLREPLTLAECQRIRDWRNAPDVFPMLRSGYLTEDQQTQFYHQHIAPQFWQRTYWQPEHQYFAIDADGRLAGVGGLTYLRRTKGETEISLVLGPHARGKGIGHRALCLLLQMAWHRGLTRVIGECYLESPARGFWQKQLCRVPGTLRLVTFDPNGTMRWTWGKP